MVRNAAEKKCSFGKLVRGRRSVRWFWTEAEGGGLKFLLLLLSEKHLYFFPQKIISEVFKFVYNLTYSFIFFKSIFCHFYHFTLSFISVFFSLHYICPLYYLDLVFYIKNQLKDVHVMYCFSIFLIFFSVSFLISSFLMFIWGFVFMYF